MRFVCDTANSGALGSFSVYNGEGQTCKMNFTPLSYMSRHLIQYVFRGSSRLN